MKKKVEKQIKKEVKKHLNGVALFLAILFLAIGAVLGFLGYKMLNKNGQTKIELTGEDVVIINLGEKYTEEGYTFIIDDINYNDSVLVEGKVDSYKKGTYLLTYTLKNEQYDIVLTRVVKVLGGGANGN